MIEVQHAGFQSSLQDAGRFGYRSFGVPWSGPMDHYNAGLARELVRNPHDATILEFYQKGPELLFSKEAIIAVTGLHFELRINGESKELYQAHYINPGDRLQVSTATASNFGYIAIMGGFDTETVLGSTCYYPGITQRSRIEKGQQLYFHQQDLPQVASRSRLRSLEEMFKVTELPILLGPEFELLSKEQQELLWNSSHTLGRNNSRMGYRFDPIQGLQLAGILTGPVQAGTVQLTPGGELIVLMRDAQTTGGYARILQLLPETISILAQQLPGTKLKFVNQSL
ncbi:biotin-dependent carboxyltransferase family protein [Gilvibacter sediminis]|uniref:5-oxoprolinase subunit C family protein n=1 Tax=Gilvibacter sediminis TaxID=379071 RepID=UPI00235078FE|nr:biotin-dependent carboxyltransferase family protein [Gilvibacter sediminis]MDC7998107.1 biotin-dependent carboxyltransferase family protein [Gilvibacter sediminis]